MNYLTLLEYQRNVTGIEYAIEPSIINATDRTRKLRCA